MARAGTTVDRGSQRKLVTWLQRTLAGTVAATLAAACSPAPITPGSEAGTDVADAHDSAPPIDTGLCSNDCGMVPDGSVSTDAGTTLDGTALDGTALDAPAADVPVPDAAARDGAVGDAGGGGDAGLAVGQLDLLVEVDNSNSMTQNQANLMAQLTPLVQLLITPPCTSAANPMPHTCVAGASGDRPVYPAFRDVHVGVIDQDLGTAGSSVPGCVNGDLGDDGLLNPIHFGLAERAHEPTTGAPAGFRPTDCTDPAEYPNFIGYSSSSSTAAGFGHDFRCNAGLYINGCGLEQQLEAVWRALIWHDASDHPGNTDPNAGFLRDNAPLLVMMLSDEEDGSVVDCRYTLPGDPACPNPEALDVFNASSTAWSSSDLNLRDYLYQSCGSEDPTWPLDRYVDPAHPDTGLPGLKPGHPERVLFAALTGVPINLPTLADGSTDWNQLVGDVGPGGADDFCGRNASPTSHVVNTMSAEGPISMRQANPDPSCASRVVPACRREGSTYNPAAPPCTTTEQYFAWPARRIAEVARRFDQSTLCGGRPCHNGVVTSICRNDYTPLLSVLVRHFSVIVGPG